MLANLNITQSMVRNMADFAEFDRAMSKKVKEDPSLLKGYEDQWNKLLDRTASSQELTEEGERELFRLSGLEIKRRQTERLRRIVDRKKRAEERARETAEFNKAKELKLEAA